VGRLFWKLFAWFTLTSLLIALALLMIARLHQPQSPTAQPLLERALQQRLDTVEALLRYGGKPALVEWGLDRRGERPRIWVIAEDGTDLLARRVPRFIRNLNETQRLTREVLAVDGQRYQLWLYRPDFSQVSSAASRLQQWRQVLPAPQRLMLFIGLSLLACGWLAWYLTRPVRLLSKGARLLAQGELEQSLAPALGNRRDELATLAHEFDGMAEALKLRQQAFQQLLNDISHELRSPLTRIRLRFGLLEKQGKMVTEDLIKIDQELARLESLIDQVLTLARLDADSHYEKSDYIDLPGLLESICHQVALEAEMKGGSVDYQAPGVSAVQPVNSELMRRAFENILRNAVSHSPEGEVVEVSARCEHDEISVRIRDRGPGVGEAELEMMFAPFVRLESSRPRGGYGLGLAIARRSIEHHGGRIAARNHPEGGLEVIIRLPLRAENSGE